MPKASVLRLYSQPDADNAAVGRVNMTTHLNIAILGAGIAGLSVAQALIKRGHTITIYDPRGFPADNASAMAGGMLAPFAEIEHMNEDWLAAGFHSMALWHDFSQNHDIDLKETGSFLLAHKADHYILERFKSQLPQSAGEMKAVSELEPALAMKFSSGLFLTQEAHLNPRKTLKALCNALKEKATFIIEAQTPENINDRFDHIIDARGMNMDDPTLRGVKGETLTVRNKELTLSRPIRLMHPRYPLYIVPREGNIFMIGATQIETENGQYPTLRSAMELMSALYTLHPSFGEADILDMKSGLRPSYPDNLPRIKRKSSTYTLGGMFRHGWLLGPVMGEALADLLEMKENPYISLFYAPHESDRHETDHQRTGT